MTDLRPNTEGFAPLLNHITINHIKGLHKIKPSLLSHPQNPSFLILVKEPLDGCKDLGTMYADTFPCIHLSQSLLDLIQRHICAPAQRQRPFRPRRRNKFVKTPIPNILPALLCEDYIEDDFAKAAPWLIHELPHSRKDIACDDSYESARRSGKQTEHAVTSETDSMYLCPRKVDLTL